MSLTFYFSPMSTASVSELVIDELEIPCERIKLDLKKGDTKKPDFLKINPNAKVPTIVHDGTVIWESSAITMYLGETFGVAKNLYPAPGPARGEAMKWICWCSVTLVGAAHRFAYNTQEWVPEDMRNVKTGEAAKTEIQGLLKILDEGLGEKQFLIGDYTIVDAHINSLLSWLRHMPIDFTSFARVNAWSERCNARPSVAKLMARGEG